MPTTIEASRVVSSRPIDPVAVDATPGPRPALSVDLRSPLGPLRTAQRVTTDPGSSGAPSLAAARQAFAGFDFSKAYLRYANSTDNGGYMRGLSDGERQISVERSASGAISVRYGSNDERGFPVMVSPELRADLEQVFRVQAETQRAESRERLRARTGPRRDGMPTYRTIEARHADDLLWAALVGSSI